MRLLSPRILRVFVALATVVVVVQVARATAPGGHFTTGTCIGTAVYDMKTKLMWQKKPDNNGTASWQSATDFCGNLNLRDNITWRAPTVKELATLVDYTAATDGGPRAAVDTSWFQQSGGTVWSSTPDASGALTVPQSGGQGVPSAYAVDFTTGQIVLRTMDSSIGIWCVATHPPQGC
jgi:hypothetical protein